jgi:hypothetical protein
MMLASELIRELTDAIRDGGDRPVVDASGVPFESLDVDLMHPDELVLE